MLSIKNSKGLSKNELLRINELINSCMGYSNLCIIDSCCYDNSNVSSNIIQPDISVYDTHNVLSNEYIIYEMINNSKISGFLGLISSDKIAMINQFHMIDKNDIKLGKKLIGMIQMVTKNKLLAVIRKNNFELVEYYKKLNFIFCELEDIDYDEEIEVVMMKI